LVLVDQERTVVRVIIWGRTVALVVLLVLGLIPPRVVVTVATGLLVEAEGLEAVEAAAVRSEEVPVRLMKAIVVEWATPPMVLLVAAVAVAVRAKMVLSIVVVMVPAAGAVLV
jgi:hypothetical protein